jgi:hypothetical protein
MRQRIGSALSLVLTSILLVTPAFARERPVFLYPADKQIIGDKAPWRFRVQLMPIAEGFSWSIFQNGRKVSERIKRGTKGNEFEINPGDVNHSQIVVADPIEVRVRALVWGEWTDPTIITVRAYEPPPVRAAQRSASAVGQPAAGASQSSPSDPAFTQGGPVFVSPANGQKIDSNGLYEFKVMPNISARGFLWRIRQNGVLVSERITGNEFRLHPGTAEHSKIVPGLIEVRVQALIDDDWTDPAIITFSAVEASRFGLADTGLLFFFFGFCPLLVYGIVKLRQSATAAHAKWVEEAYKRALANAGLPDALKQPAERLCLDILSYEGAFQNRRLSPQKIEVVLRGWLYWLLHNKDKQLRIPNLLADEKGAEPAFSLPLYRLLVDVSAAIHGVSTPIVQYLSYADGTGGSALCRGAFESTGAAASPILWSSPSEGSQSRGRPRAAGARPVVRLSA